MSNHSWFCCSSNDTCGKRNLKAGKVAFRSSPSTATSTQVFLRPNAFPVAQSTVSKHWRENITFHGLAYSKLIWGSSKFVSWPLIAPDYLGEGLPCLSSALWCQYPTCMKQWSFYFRSSFRPCLRKCNETLIFLFSRLRIISRAYE